MRERLKALGAPVLSVAFWLLAWQGVATALDKPFLLASPIEVTARFGELAVTSEFWKTVGFSLSRIGVGFVAALAVGSVFAVAAAGSRIVATLLAPLIAAIRSAPVVSFIILLLLWVDNSVLAAATSFLMVLPVVFANVGQGIRTRDRELLEAAAVFGIPWPRRVLAIDVPAVVPFLVAASRAGVGLAWKSGVAAEVIGVTVGSIGEKLHDSKVFLESADLFAWTAVIVVLSVLCERLVVWALARLPHAHGREVAS